MKVQRACEIVHLSRAAYYHQTLRKTSRADDRPVITAFQEVIEKHGQWGFWKCHHYLRNKGHLWNHKRTWRVYKMMHWHCPRRMTKKITRPPQPLRTACLPNEIWSMDFMSDTFGNGHRRLRTLNVLDEGVREALAIEINTSLPAVRVLQTLERLEVSRGLPKAIRVDNGPEFTSHIFVNWCKNKQIELLYIQPGKPNQNAFIERFNRSYRAEVLNCSLFQSLQHARELTEQWLRDYNEERPHASLKNLPPKRYHALIMQKFSTFKLSN